MFNMTMGHNLLLWRTKNAAATSPCLSLCGVPQGCRILQQKIKIKLKVPSHAGKTTKPIQNQDIQKWFPPYFHHADCISCPNGYQKRGQVSPWPFLGFRSIEVHIHMMMLRNAMGIQKRYKLFFWKNMVNYMVNMKWNSKFNFPYHPTLHHIPIYHHKI